MANERARIIGLGGGGGGGGRAGRPWVEVVRQSQQACVNRSKAPSVGTLAACSSAAVDLTNVAGENAATTTGRRIAPTAMDRIFRGIMKYRQTNRKQMVEQFVHVKNHPEVRHRESSDRIVIKTTIVLSRASVVYLV